MHVCCAGCVAYPLRIIKEELGAEVSLFFFNPNIQPYTEWLKRAEAVKEYAEKTGTHLIIFPHYDIVEFLRQMTFRENEKCRICYHTRLKRTGQIAQKGNYNYFSSTLLGSKQQGHDLIKDLSEDIGREYRVEFYYKDFRAGR